MELADILKKHSIFYDLFREQYAMHSDKEDDEIDEIYSESAMTWGMALDRQLERERQRNLYKFH